MDYTQLIETYYINRDTDHHLVKGEPITTNEGAIGVTTKVMDGDKEVDGASIVLWLKPGSEVGTFPMVFCHKEIDPTTEEETFTDAMQYNDDGTMTIIDATYTAMTPYKQLEAGKSFLDLTLNNMLEHVFVEAASLTKEEKEELAALTDMGASELLEEYLDNNAEGDVVNGDGDPSDMNISGDPGSVSHAKVVFSNPDTPDKITWFDWNLSMMKPDGTSSTLPPYIISDKEKESCTLTCPDNFPGSSCLVKVIYTYKTAGSNIKRRCKGTFIVGGWNDPVIMVWDEDTYDKCDELNMVLSPAAKDADFVGCKDLTMAQMVNEPVMTICKTKGWLTSHADKAQYLVDNGVDAAEAEVLADKFMTLKEARNVNLSMVSSKGVFEGNTSITHLESLAYFTQFGSSASNGQRLCFGCTNLTVVYLPPTIKYVPGYAFSGCGLLDTVKSLKD